MTLQLIKVDKNKFKSWIILFSTIIALYFWDFGAKYNLGIDTRYLTLLPLLFYLKKESLSNNGLFIVGVINLYVIFTYIYNYSVYERVITLFDFKSFFGFSLTLFVAFFCKDIILLNKEKITKFLFVLTPFFFINSDFFIWNDINLLWQCAYFGYTEAAIFKLFFLENSHYAMVAIPVFLLNLFWICKKFKLINFLLLISFFVAMIIFQSTTMVMAMLIILPTTIFISWSKNNSKFILSCLIFLLIYIFIFINIYGCSRKVSDLLSHTYINAVTTVQADSKIEKAKGVNDKLEILIAKKFIIFYEKFDDYFYTSLKSDPKAQLNKEKLISNTDLIAGSDKSYEKQNSLFKVNVSSQVIKNSFVVAIKTVKEKPLGIGFNRFEDAFMKQISSQKAKYSDEIMQINRNDGASNFNKLLGEFGYILIVILIYLIIFIFSKKVSIETKLFLFPIVITQMIRGAGYFNGGFLLSVALIIMVIHGTKKEN